MHESAAELYRMATGRDLDQPDRRTLAHMLARDAEGKWLGPEFRVPTGDGRAVLEARALAGLFLLGEVVVWSVRGRELLKERFYWLRAMVEGTESLWAEVSRVRCTNGDERIETRSGGRLLFASASSTAVRGLSIDCCLLDGHLRDIQDLRAQYWPSMMARPNPQMVINYGSVSADGADRRDRTTGCRQEHVGPRAC